MRILIGVDEAGYGPQLGPLAVAATAWWVEEKGSGVRGQEAGGRRRRTPRPREGARAVASPPAVAHESFLDLYSLLETAVVRSPAECAQRVAIADSKALYKSGTGLGHLERGVLAALCVLGSVQRRFSVALDLIAATQADEHDRRRRGAWHFDDALPLPVDSDDGDLERAADLLDQTSRARGAALVGVRARLVFPEEFNDLVEHFGNKASALSHVTLELVRRLVDMLPADETIIYLDKHGGRNRYASLVQHHFAESWVETVVESRAESRYRWQHRGATVEAVFRVGCEELLPTALASMTAKYHREVAMLGFNAFWAKHVPGLRPTAGYYGDSRRFKEAIDGVQRELGIADRALWRCR